MVVRAALERARKHGWIEANPASEVDRVPVRYRGDYGQKMCQHAEAWVKAGHYIGPMSPPIPGSVRITCGEETWYGATSTTLAGVAVKFNGRSC
jgi:hypothetical protein